MKKIAAILIVISILSGFHVFAEDGIESPIYPGVARQEMVIENEWIVFLESMLIFNKYYYKEITQKEFARKVLKGGVSSIDRFSYYLAPEEIDSLMEETEGYFSGVGLSLGEKIKDKETFIEVVAVLPGTPAEKAGIKPGDFVVAVSSNGIKKEAVSTAAMSIQELVALIKGEINTNVYLYIRRGNEYLDFTVERQKVEIEKISSSVIKEKIGYIKIIDFIKDGLDSDFIKTVNELKEKGMKCLIIDLRNNPGGLLTMAVNISIMFRDIEFDRYRNPPIVTLEGKEVNRNVSGPILYSGIFKDLKVVILTNRSSASASEIVTAYLKNYCGAKIVGEKTYGKGVGQGVYGLKNGGALVVTSFEYFVGQKRVAVHGIGIPPDYEVIGSKDDQEDPQMKKAIEVAEEMLGK